MRVNFSTPIYAKTHWSLATCYKPECSSKWHLPKAKRIAPVHAHGVRSRGYSGMYKRNGNTCNNSSPNYEAEKQKYHYIYNQRSAQITDSRRQNRDGHYSGTPEGHVRGSTSGRDHRGTDQALNNPNSPNENPPANDNDFSFLMNLIQVSVKKNVQWALQEMNIPGQILQELSQFQAQKQTRN